MASDLLAAAVAHHQAGRLPEAETLYRQVLARDPSQPDALHLLGLLFHQAGRSDLALPLIQRAIVLNPQAAAFHNNVSEVLRSLGQLAKSVDAVRSALALRPVYPDAQLNLSMALQALGQLDAAERAARTALEQRPGHAGSWLTLGNVLHAAGSLDEAADAFGRAIAAAPRDALAHNNLGLALMELGRAADAQEALRGALRIRPDYREACSNLLLASHYDTPAGEAGALWDAHRGFAAMLPRDVPRPPRHDPPNPRLRIGYVSPDLWLHPVGLFLLPVIESHDRERVEVFCYCDGTRQDAVTARFRAESTFRQTTGLADGQLADMVRQDRIDVLIDLSGHTAGNRLGAFALRPAAVLATWLGYPDTTGLGCIDLRLTDALCDPEGAERWHAERLLRLPQGFLCYRAHEAPAVSAPPTLRGGKITFGSFNNLAKVSPTTLSLWAKALAAVPSSRLLLKARALASSSARQRIADTMARHGIAPNRLEFLPPIPGYAAHLSAYGRIDIALDTFPYHGTTTTCEALWMGVPVITRIGTSHVSRVGLSILSHAGQGQWAADSDERFVAIARELAADVARLVDIRHNLRQILSQSRLCDAEGFTRALEDALLLAVHETPAV